MAIVTCCHCDVACMYWLRFPLAYTAVWYMFFILCVSLMWVRNSTLYCCWLWAVLMCELSCLVMCCNLCNVSDYSAKKKKKNVKMKCTAFLLAPSGTKTWWNLQPSTLTSYWVQTKSSSGFWCCCFIKIYKRSRGRPVLDFTDTDN